MASQPELADVIKEITADVTTIVKGEIELAKAELVPQAKSMGIGAGMFGGAGYFALNGIALLFLAISALIGHGFAAGLGWSAPTGCLHGPAHRGHFHVRDRRGLGRDRQEQGQRQGSGEDGRAGAGVR